jgi:hypothetical protein
MISDQGSTKRFSMTENIFSFLRKRWLYILCGGVFSVGGLWIWKADLGDAFQTILSALALGLAAAVAIQSYLDSRKAYAGERRKVFIGVECNRDVASAVADYFGIEKLDEYFSANAMFGTKSLSKLQKKKMSIAICRKLDAYQNCEIHLVFQGPYPILANIFRWTGLSSVIVLHTYDTALSGLASDELITRDWME